MKKIALIATLLLTPALVGAETFVEAFEKNRAMYGKDHVFEWNGKQYRTAHQEEVEAAVPATKDNAEAMLAKAEAKNKEVAALGYEWRFTRDILAKARTALEEGDYRKALDLSAQAKYHARMGIRQYNYAQTNWGMSVPE